MKAKRISWLLLAAALGLTAQAAHSASITVDAGGVCTLAEAITSANNDNAAGNGCVNGSGADIIILQMDVTLAAVLPTIASAITIEGGGKTINGNNGNFSVLKIVSGGNLTLKNATITGGHPLADNGGGIYADTGSTVILNSCTVSGNTAGGSFGGGIYAASLATVTLNNSTVSGNTCSISGGGIGAAGAGAEVTLNNSTVSNNTANGTVTGGGGIIVIEDTASVTLRSSIVSGNTAPNVDGDEVYTANSGTVTANSYNVFGHSGQTNAQAYSSNGAVFAPGATDINATSDGTTPKALNLILNTTLANNGGPTQTHALVVGSPAIDRDATCSTGLSTDQRGYTRQINFKCDAGAVEYSPSFNLASGNGRDLRARTWLMTAPSCVPNPVDIGTQYNELGGYNTNWKAWTWDVAGSPQLYVTNAPGDPLTPGNGNWLYSLNAATLTVTGTATPTVPCSNYGSGLSGNCFAINLIPSLGTALWQMLGHPFPYNVSWADVRVATCGSSCGTPANWTQRTPTQAAAASIMAKEMQRWSGSSYQPKDDNIAGGMLGTLLPQEAVWVRMLPGSSAFSPGNIKLLVPAR